MKNRVTLWAVTGFLVSLTWFIYAVTRVAPITLGSQLLWTFAKVTQPVVFLPLPLKFYWVFLANALTYGSLGFMFEFARRRLFSAR
jgi:hypothetical protein